MIPWLFVVLSGCLAPCGDLAISGTTATDYEDKDYNGHWNEQCGKGLGSTGTWNLFGDGNAEIQFRAAAAGSRDWQGIDIEIAVSFPNGRLGSGETIDIEEMFGSAGLNPCIDCLQDIEGLTAGTIEVLSGDDGVDPCEGEGPIYKVHWDLTYGDAPGPLYEVEGTDRVLFMNFLSDDCDTL